LPDCRYLFCIFGLGWHMAICTRNLNQNLMMKDEETRKENDDCHDEDHDTDAADESDADDNDDDAMMLLR